MLLHIHTEARGASLAPDHEIRNRHRKAFSYKIGIHKRDISEDLIDLYANSRHVTI
jgi:hypothetical protein